MKGQAIVCFAKDWGEDPTSNNHVMVELARDNRVLWLNSVSTRVPSLGSSRDLKKLLSKLASFFRGAEEKRPGLWVYTPIVIPLPHSRWATTVNRWILGAAVKHLRRKLGMNDFQLWTFLPNVGDYVGRLGESFSVYYCVDEWSQFNYVDGPRTASAERDLIAKVDLVFAAAQSLVDNRMGLNPETHLARHGVDHAQFARALDESTAVPPDLAALPGPVIGFYGTIQDWIDFDLIAHLASRRPEWSFVMIGRRAVDTSRMNAYANVHWLGSRPHEQLPSYCKGFSVGIIPYILNERILHVNPLKLREYLSAGLPVVSTALPEVKLYPRFCAVAASHEEFERAIEQAIKSDSPQKRVERSEAMKLESWEQRVAELTRHVVRVKSLVESRTTGQK